MHNFNVTHRIKGLFVLLAWVWINLTSWDASCLDRKTSSVPPVTVSAVIRKKSPSLKNCIISGDRSFERFVRTGIRMSKFPVVRHPRTMYAVTRTPGPKPMRGMTWLFIAIRYETI